MPGILKMADQIHQEEALEGRDKAPLNTPRSMQTEDSTQTLSLEIPAKIPRHIWQQIRVTPSSARNFQSLSSGVMSSSTFSPSRSFILPY